MAIAAYFLAPILMGVLIIAGIALPSILALYVIPLIVWIILGEVLLSSISDRKKRLEVAVVAFVIYTILTFIGVPVMIGSFIPF
jgi:hypothetical protein